MDTIDEALSFAGYAIDYNIWCPTGLIDRQGTTLMAGAPFRDKAMAHIDMDDDE